MHKFTFLAVNACMLVTAETAAAAVQPTTPAHETPVHTSVEGPAQGRGTHLLSDISLEEDGVKLQTCSALSPCGAIRIHFISFMMTTNSRYAAANVVQMHVARKIRSPLPSIASSVDFGRIETLQEKSAFTNFLLDPKPFALRSGKIQQ